MIKTKFNFSLFLVSVVFFTSIIFAQEKSHLTKQQFKVQRDSLVNLKNNLTAVNKKMRSEIDSLKSYSSKLDDKIKHAKYELYVLKYGKKNGTRVYAGKVWKGMTDKMLRDSWGKPDKIHKDVYKWGVFTQWYYGNITYFFKNHKLTDWEQKKDKK